jgi:hypothetical protein
VIARSPVAGQYDEAVDRESAHEILTRRAEETAAAETREQAVAAREKAERKTARAPRASNRQGIGEAFAKSVVRTVGSQLGRALLRGLLGSLSRR